MSDRMTIEESEVTTPAVVEDGNNKTRPLTSAEKKGLMSSGPVGINGYKKGVKDLYETCKEIEEIT